MHTDSHGQEFTLPGPFTSLAEVKALNFIRGYHFFNAGTMRFFDSRAAGPIYGRRLFVTSERFEGESRRYTIRVAHDDGSIGTLGEFQQFATLRGAATFIRHTLAEAGL